MVARIYKVPLPLEITRGNNLIKVVLPSEMTQSRVLPAIVRSLAAHVVLIARVNFRVDLPAWSQIRIT